MLDVSLTPERHHNHSGPASSLEPLINHSLSDKHNNNGLEFTFDTPMPSAIVGSNSNSMSACKLERSTSESSSVGSPPAPHTKPPTRVFSKKTVNGVKVKPLPIPGAATRSRFSSSRGGNSEPRDDQRWEMAPREDGVQDSLTPVKSPSRSWSSIARIDENEHDDDVLSNGFPYLTPRDSPPPSFSSQFSARDSPPNISIDVSSTSLPKLRGNGKIPLARFDSGVEDVEFDSASRRGRWSSDAPSSTVSGTSSSSPAWSSPGRGSSPGPGSSRLSTHLEQHYEDIDAYKKYHQPHDTRNSTSTSRLSEEDIPGPNALRALPKVYIAGVTHSDSDDNTSLPTLNKAPPKPDVDPRGASLPHTYHHLQLNGGYLPITKQPRSTSPSRSNRCGSCLIISAIILVFFISMASLGLSIYIIIGDHKHESRAVSSPLLSEPNSSVILQEPYNSTQIEMTARKLEEAVRDLQNELHGLRDQNVALKEKLDGTEEELKNALKKNSAVLIKMSRKHQEMSTYVSSMEVNLAKEIANIQVTPGPMGPQGVANFSLCEVRMSQSSAAASNLSDTPTSLLPSDRESKDYFPIFAYCSKSGAKEVELRSESDRKESKHQYQCVCSGTVKGQSTTVCTVHVVICPRLQ